LNQTDAAIFWLSWMGAVDLNELSESGKKQQGLKDVAAIGLS
jgi:hypothetical protein